MVKTALRGARARLGRSGISPLDFEASQPNASGELAGTAGENLGPVTLHSATALERSLLASAAWGLAQHP